MSGNLLGCSWVSVDYTGIKREAVACSDGFRWRTNTKGRHCRAGSDGFKEGSVEEALLCTLGNVQRHNHQDL